MADFLDVKWFCSGHGNVGIVRVQNDYYGYDDDNEIKYYIAKVTGKDEQADIQWVMQYGSSFPKDAGDVLFGVKE